MLAERSAHAQPVFGASKRNPADAEGIHAQQISRVGGGQQVGDRSDEAGSTATGKATPLIMDFRTESAGAGGERLGRSATIGPSPMDLRLLPYQPDRDAYRLLGVPPSAGPAEIVTACRRLARAFHPDRNDSQRATEEMQVVNAVRSLLSDPRSRAEYDRARLSFWSATTRRRPVSPARPVRPAHNERLPRPAVAERAVGPAISRTARAAMTALLAMLRFLPPARCDDCAAWVEPDYRFCAACGASLRAAVQVSVDRSR